MNEFDEYPEESRRKDMDTPDHYIDLNKYESIGNIDEEIKKLKQDIQIRRSVHQRMGINDDDETVMIIEEKIKLLETRKQKMRSEQRSDRRLVYIVLFSIIFIPLLMTAPLNAAILVAIILVIRAISILIRKIFRKMKQSMEKSIEKLESKDKKEQITDQK